MLILYSLLTLLLIIALGIISISFVTSQGINKRMLLKRFSIVSLFIILSSTGLYYLLTDHEALEQWLTHGKQHYELMVQLEQLGGIDGVIAKIQQKLHDNPNDAQGWLILSKLYKMKNDLPHAAAALKKAQQLQNKTH